MIVTTVWGTPAPETASRIPATPCLSILGVDGERLRARLASGPLRLRMTTRVRTGWMPIPHLVGELRGREEDRFVLFSGHVDSWHYGAMDNGTANATMLEVARLLAARRQELRRGIRFAFWSGHSHGRYAGSAWYADHAWRELHQRCVLHLNVDSTGARGATDYSVLHATEDAHALRGGVSWPTSPASRAAGGASRARAISRSGAPGCPRPSCRSRGCPSRTRSSRAAMERLVGSAGFPWWWHTKDDTIDKIDPDVLVLDTKVYVASALRWLNAPVLPLDHTRAAQALLGELRGAAGRGRRALRSRPGAGGRPRARRAAASAWPPPWTRSIRPRRRRGARRSTGLSCDCRGSWCRWPTPSGDRFTHDLARAHPAAGRAAARARAGPARSRRRRVQVRAGGARPRAQPCGARPRLGGLGGRRADGRSNDRR